MEITWVGKCVRCGKGYRGIGGVGEWSGPHISCPCDIANGHPASGINFRPLNAKVGTKACNAKCEDSASPMCVCKCGGTNHGLGLERSAA